MSKWLDIVEGAGKEIKPLPDNRTKPCKTPKAGPENTFCTVLHGCRAGELEKVSPFGTDQIAKVQPVAKTGSPKDIRHGLAVNGNPKTWTGNIVSLNQWRRLSEWEKHGPDGRHWNGITCKWEHEK